MNFVEVEVTREGDEYHARREGFDVVVPSDRGEKVLGEGKVILGIRPEDVTIADEGIPGEIYVVEPLGRDDLLDVRIGEAGVHVLADPTLGLRMGQIVTLDFNTRKVQFFDPQTEMSLLWTD
jgi:ABC-type sugar transport system ATPase subunit